MTTGKQESYDSGRIHRQIEHGCNTLMLLFNDASSSISVLSLPVIGSPLFSLRSTGPTYHRILRWKKDARTSLQIIPTSIKSTSKTYVQKL